MKYLKYEYEITPEMVYGAEFESKILAGLSKSHDVVGFRPPLMGETFLARVDGIDKCRIESYPKYSPRFILTPRKVRKYVFTERVPQPSRISTGDFYMFPNEVQSIFWANESAPRWDYIVLTREIVEE